MSTTGERLVFEPHRVELRKFLEGVDAIVMLNEVDDVYLEDLLLGPDGAWGHAVETLSGTGDWCEIRSTPAMHRGQATPIDFLKANGRTVERGPVLLWIRDPGPVTETPAWGGALKEIAVRIDRSGKKSRVLVSGAGGRVEASVSHIARGGTLTPLQRSGDEAARQADAFVRAVLEASGFDATATPGTCLAQ